MKSYLLIKTLYNIASGDNNRYHERGYSRLLQDMDGYRLTQLLGLTDVAFKGWSIGIDLEVVFYQQKCRIVLKHNRWENLRKKKKKKP